jgi:CHAD domain-containing protein
VVNENEFQDKIVEEDDKQGLEPAVGDTQPAVPPDETPDFTAIRRALTRLLRKRVKKFVALVPEVLTSANPKTVHDARVWSRRLQQAVSAFFPKPRSGKVRRLRRTPRRIRRALGEWRNCDVLLEIIARQQRRTRSEAKRRAWAFVHDYLLQKRSKQVARAGKKLVRHDLESYVSLAHRLLDQPPDENPEILMQRLCTSVQGAWTKWKSALARAQETRAVNDLHVLRIATKDLRYRTELLYDVGHRQLKAQLKWLADLQEALGVWHDRQVLHQAVAGAVARAEILLNELQTARILLAELETDRNRQAQDVENIFRLAVEHPGHKQMESWSEIHATTTTPLPVT